MMKRARLYDTPAQFAAMIVNRLSEGLDVNILQEDKEDPLRLIVELKPGNSLEKLHVNLHNAYRTYMAGGDLNTAVDSINDTIRIAKVAREGGDKMLRLDPSWLYPAVRDERYVSEAGAGGMLSEPYAPGLRVIFLETGNDVTKIVTENLLRANPQLTAESVKRHAYRNLRHRGRQRPRLVMSSPHRSSCAISVYMDSSYPSNCQFLLPELAARRMPDQYLIAFPNRLDTLVMQTAEPMNTKKQAAYLADKSKFREMVRDSYTELPHPLSNRLYWVCGGKTEVLEETGASHRNNRMEREQRGNTDVV